MKLNKANLAGLTSPGQQSEMKSILAGSWPPLKPLPVFKYETPEYRATISFDRKCGEWVCRKTSFPSNEVQELRGGLREITLALPHGEAEIFTEGEEQQEQELEKDAHRRVQAIAEWKEKYKSGALYFELREFLSEVQRAELDDSLRLSLTARQLQFNSKNAADVFDDLSVAGGRFAALVEFATRNKAKQGTDASAQEEGTLPGAECVPNNDEHSLEISSPEVEGAPNSLNSNDPVVQDQETPERSTGVDEFPALSIKNVFPEPDQPTIAERMPHVASQQFEIETSYIADEDFPSLAEPSRAERSYQEDRAPLFTDFAAEAPTGQPLPSRMAGSPSRFPALKISAFQANIFALLFLFAVTSFTVGLTVGRGPLGKRLREAPKSLLAADAKPQTLPNPVAPSPAEPDATDESTPQTQPPLVASSDDTAGANTPTNAAPSEEKHAASEEKPKESPRLSDPAERSTDADSSPAIESKPSPKPEVNPEPAGTIGPIVRSVSPPGIPKLVRGSSKGVRRRKVVSKAARLSRSAPRNPAPYRLASAIATTPHAAGAAPHVTRSSTILVTVPDRGNQPFRVSFPSKTIAATSSLAMTSQLSVLVPPEPGPAVAPKSARLEAGELVSFGWPRYPSSPSGLAETIRVRATIGQLGQVQEVKFLGGSALLLPATTEAIRQWRYAPTLLDKRPVQAQQDVTIEFRPPQYSAQLATRQHPSHN